MIDISLAALAEPVSATPLASGLFDVEGRLVSQSARWSEIIPPTDANLAVLNGPKTAAIAGCLLNGAAHTGPLAIRDLAGAPRWVDLELGAVRDPDGAVIGFLAHGSDVTVSVTHSVDLQQSEQRYTAALAMARMVIKEINLKTGQAFISASCPQFAAMAAEQGVALDTVHPGDRARLQAAIETCKRGRWDQPMSVEYRLAGPEETWVCTVNQVFYDPQGEPERVLLITQDITDKVRSRQEIENLAFVDSLTGLPNRARFQREYERACHEADALGRPFALVMIDVDHFKDINDTLGHDAGDQLLKELAGHMKAVFRRDDLVARLGGDEFAILLRSVGTDEEMVRPLQALRRALAKPVHFEGQEFCICASIGTALHSGGDSDPEHLLKNADIALYKAKEGGRDKVVVFESEMRSELERKVELLRDVRGAIPKGEFILFYQPVVALQGEGTVTGFEALMRWQHPDQGILAPAHFMAAFDDQGLALELDKVTIDGALKQMRQWMDEGIEFGRVSINLSAAQFRTGNLAEDLRGRLQYWGVPPEKLTVELTEHVYMGWGAEAVADTVRTLHDHGVTIALDDFGTGYASLANLRQFPIDRLKIDKSFVQNAEDEGIVRAVINLGASMGVEVVAEGVELPETLAALEGFGCEHVQGYHFAKPMPAAEVPGYLRSFRDTADAAGKSVA